MQGSENRVRDWSDALPVEARRIVDLCVERTAAQVWRQRRDTIEATIATGPVPLAKNMTGFVVAAVIERLNTPGITDCDQAQLFAMSACLEHQTAACDWFIEAAANPVLAMRVFPAASGMSLH